MAVQFNEFIEHAERLLGGGESSSELLEIDGRCAISRAYYAAFHCATGYADVVADVPPSTMSGPTHKNLSDFFIQAKHDDAEVQRSWRRIGYRLHQFHAERCKADYRLHEMIATTDAKAHVSRCRTLLADINTLGEIGVK